jgi:hypothetical protein
VIFPRELAELVVERLASRTRSLVDLSRGGIDEAERLSFAHPSPPF